MTTPRPSFTDLWKLKRWNTPARYNRSGRIRKHDPMRNGIDSGEVRDFMLQIPPRVGFAGRPGFIDYRHDAQEDKEAHVAYPRRLKEEWKQQGEI